jgi:hypothetical protein
MLMGDARRQQRRPEVLRALSALVLVESKKATTTNNQENKNAVSVPVDGSLIASCTY